MPYFENGVVRSRRTLQARGAGYGLVGIVVLGLGAAAQAQEAEQPSSVLQSSARPNERINPEQARKAPIFLQADRLQSQADLESVAEGDAVLRKAGTVIRADRLEYDQASDQARATGNVHIKRNGNTYEGPYMELKVDAFEGFFTEPRYTFIQNGSHGQAQRADFLDNTHLTVHQASYTTCRRKPGPDWVPDWVLNAAQIDLDNDEDIGQAQSAYLSFKGFPIMHVLPISFPLSEKRKSGLLPPTIGLDNGNGLELTTPYYIDIAPNRDATVTPTFMTARGVNIGTEFRYLEPRYAGSARLSYMPQDLLRGSDRWGTSLTHNGSVDSPIGAMGVVANINRVSDNNYWRDFTTGSPVVASSTLAGGTQRLLPADLSATWGRGDFSSAVKVLKWQTLQDVTAPITPPYDRVPQWGARYAQRNVHGLDWSLDGDFTQFESDRALTGQPNAQRSFAWAQASYPVIGPAGFLTPKLQLHTTSYAFDAIYKGTQSAASTVPTFSLDTGLVFERQTQVLGQSVLQTLEPRVFYVYSPFVDQSGLPNYDTGANDFNFATIYTENAYVGHDKISDNNLLTLGLTTRYLDGASGAQLASFGVAQRLRIQEQQVTGAAAGLSDILLGAALNIDSHWVLDSTVQYNSKANLSERAVIGARYNPGNYRVLNLAYRFQREQSEQIDTSWQWPLNDFWGDRGSDLGAGRGQGEGRYYGIGRLNYSLNEGRLVNTVLGLEYDAGCWISRVVLERVQTSTDSATARLMFQLEFVGFTRLGLSPQQTLTSNISRYQNLRDNGSSASRFSNYD